MNGKGSSYSSPSATINHVPHANNNLELADELHRDELFQSVESRDLMAYGLIPEFVGRFPVLVSLTSLQRDALVRVLTEPQNSLVSQYTQLLKMDKVCSMSTITTLFKLECEIYLQISPTPPFFFCQCFN